MSENLSDKYTNTHGGLLEPLFGKVRVSDLDIEATRRTNRDEVVAVLVLLEASERHLLQVPTIR